MVKKTSRDPEADLAELRERLGLYEHLPSLDDLHVLGFSPMNGAVALCAHDETNAATHTLMFEPLEKGDMSHVLTPDGELTDDIKVSCAHVIRASYN